MTPCMLRPCLAALALAALLAGGCGSSDKPTTGDLRIVNGTGVTLSRIYLSPASAWNWGPDQLGREVVLPGEAFTIRHVSAGTYDLKMQFADGDVLYEMGFRIHAGETRTVTVVEGPTTGEVRIVNQTDVTIQRAYLSPASAWDWGPDQLGSSVIVPGGSYTIAQVPPRTYDLKLIFADNDVVYEMGFAVFAGETHTITVVDSTGSLRVVNGTTVTMLRLYLSPSDSNDWGPDQLGDGVIAPGDSFTVARVPAGIYDLKTEFADGDTVYAYAFSVRAGEMRTLTVVQTVATGIARASPGRRRTCLDVLAHVGCN